MNLVIGMRYKSSFWYKIEILALVLDKNLGFGMRINLAFGIRYKSWLS
jgi:hypothetical protein